VFAPVAHAFGRRMPDAHVLGWAGERALTWQEVRACAAGVAGELEARGASAAVLACSRPLLFLSALLGTWLAGREALVPQSLQPQAVGSLAGDGIVLLDDEHTASQRAGHAGRALPAPHACRLALYTSGSTGVAKRVEKTLAQLDREVEALEALWGAAVGASSVLSTVPHYHIYGLLFRVLWPFAAARAADELTCADPLQLRALAARRGRHVLVSTPAHLARFPQLLPLAEWQPPQRIFSSGGPLDAPSAARYREALGAAPLEIFGSTETGGVAWRQRDGSAGEDAWTPFAGIGVALDHDGALLLDSPYLAQPAWRMDDCAEMLPGGRFMLRGRLDRVVKVEGKRLSLPQLEQMLLDHEWVAAAAAVALPGSQRVGVALVLSTPGAAALKSHGARALRDALRRHLGRGLDPSLLPRSFRFVERLPFDERGKLAVAAVAQLFGAAR
jgi:acyl-coenzyme A synthetase/AMP-(fatty) acid ligase